MGQAEDDAWRETAEHGLALYESILDEIIALALDSQDPAETLAIIALMAAKVNRLYGDDGSEWKKDPT